MSEYLGTIIVAAIIVLMVFFIVRGMVKDRKKGNSALSAHVSILPFMI